MEQEDRIKSLQMGADDYLTKPFHHLELQAGVKNVISVHKLEREKTRTEQLEVFLMVLASAIESKDQYTGGHVERGKPFDPDLFDLFMDEEDKLYLRYINTQLFKEVS